MAKRTKLVTRESTLSGAVSDAMSELQSLRDEMQEWKDSMEERLFHTEKYERVSEAADTLDQYCENEPDAPEKLPTGLEDKVTWQESLPYGNRSPSRATRLANTTIVLRLVAETIENFLGEHEDEEDEVFKDTSRSDWELYAYDITDICDNVEGVEFPGMYG